MGFPGAAFSRVRTGSSIDSTIDSVLIRENTGQRKFAFWYILSSGFLIFSAKSEKSDFPGLYETPKYFCASEKHCR